MEIFCLLALTWSQKPRRGQNALPNAPYRMEISQLPTGFQDGVGSDPADWIKFADPFGLFNEENGIDPFTSGVVVLDIARRSAADYFGFQPGDRLLSLDGDPIETLSDAEAVLDDLDGARRWPVEIERRGDRFSRVLSL